MAESVYNSFVYEQHNTLTKYKDLVSVNIKNIETVGYGSE